MDAIAIGMIVMVVALIAAPFAALRAAAHFRNRRTRAAENAKPGSTDTDERDKPEGFW